MTRAQKAAREISSYLLTGMHHCTPEGQVALTSIIARHLSEQAGEQAQFWVDCIRDIVRDKDQQITNARLYQLREFPGSPLIVAEIKDRSPFNVNYKAPDRYIQFRICEAVGDIISVHTNPLWGGSWEWLSEVRKMTDKPILAKGFHPTAMDVREALNRGANYVLTVGWVPGGELFDKCWHECETIEQLRTTPAKYRVWNVRDPRTGENRFTDWEEGHDANKGGWLCRASRVRSPADVEWCHSAILIGKGLYKKSK